MLRNTMGGCSAVCGRLYIAFIWIGSTSYMLFLCVFVCVFHCLTCVFAFVVVLFSVVLSCVS